MPVAVVHRGRGGPIGELHEDRVRADRASLWVPIESRRSDTADLAAAEKANDVELVRPLPERDAAARIRQQLVGPARPIDPVGEIPGMDHAHAPELAARDDFPHPLDWQIVTMSVADEQRDSRTARLRDHRAGLIQAYRHRLLGKDMLLSPECQGGVLGV